MKTFRQILTTPLILLISIIYAQNSKSKFVVESESFLQKLDSTKLKSEKINLIKQKIKNDSVFEFTNSDRVIIRVNKNETVQQALERRVECKILFFINYKKSLLLLDLFKNPDLNNFIDELDENIITEIEIFKPKRAMELFGVRGNCGTIILKTNYKMLKKMAKKTKTKL